MPNKPKNNDEVCHQWANFLESSGECGNMRYTNGVLYSYRTKIGVITDGPNGKVALLSTASYSVTTSGKHYHPRNQACSHYERIFVDSVDYLQQLYDSVSGWGGWAVAQLEHKTLELQTAKRAIVRAKDTAWKLQCFERDLASAQKLIEFVEYKCADYPIVQAPLKALKLEMVMPDNLDELKAQCNKEAAAKRAETKLNKEKAARYGAEQVYKWRKCEIQNIPYGVDLQGKTLLRVNEDGSLNTSKGIKIPRDDADKMLFLFNAGRLRGHSFQGYTITHVDHDKRLVIAGCHTISFDEIEAVAKALRQEAS